MIEVSGASPRMSIVMPNYNHGHMISEAFSAIARQTMPPFEVVVVVVVVDDGSTDDSVSRREVYFCCFVFALAAGTSAMHLAMKLLRFAPASF